MFSDNPLTYFAQRLDRLEAQQAEVLQLLRGSTTNANYQGVEKAIGTAEAAKQFGIAKQTLYQNAKKIRHTKRFGRLYFYPSDLREYLNAGEGLSA